MFIDTECFCCYYISVRLCTGGVRVPLNELASERRITGSNSLLRSLKADKVEKIFLSKEADEKLLREIIMVNCWNALVRELPSSLVQSRTFNLRERIIKFILMSH